jgi:hypothetical protein
LLDDQIHRLVYASAPNGWPGNFILDIARVAERRNADLSCSGLLLYGDLGYFQIIEGSLVAVKELLSSLSIDSRHRIIWKEVSGPCGRCISPSLPMGYFDQSECFKAEIHMPNMHTSAAKVSKIILDAAAYKYPDAML